MNISQLRYLKAVADTSSFSQAAEQCCVTQPTLSNGVAQLEKQLGGKLFKRTTRSVSLTKFGAFVLPLAEAVLDARDELEHAARSFFEPQGRILRIGMSPLVDSPLLNQALGSYPGRDGWSEVFLKQCFLDDLVDRLDQETLDIALLPHGTKSHSHQSAPLYEEDLFYLPPQTDLESRTASNAISLDELDGQPIILTQGCGLSDVIADLFADGGVTLNRYTGQALSYSVVEEWAGLGIAGGILPRSKLSDRAVSARPIVRSDGQIAKVSYDAIWAQPDQDGCDDDVGQCAAHLSATMAALSTGLAE